MLLTETGSASLKYWKQFEIYIDLVSYKDSISKEVVVLVVFTFRSVSIIVIIDLIAMVSLVKAFLFEE